MAPEEVAGRTDRAGAVRSTALELVATLLPACPIILESGSHNGSDTAVLSATWPRGRIYAIEPTPHNYAAVAARNLPNVISRQFAFSSENGVADFHVEQSGDGGASSLLPAEAWFLRDYIKNEETIQVATKTLDAWCHEEGLDHIDFLWLDVEGMELPVLEHGHEIVKTLKAVFTEVNFVSARRGYTMYPALDEFLRARGFHEAWRAPQGGGPWGTWTGNVLYVRHPL